MGHRLKDNVDQVLLNSDNDEIWSTIVSCSPGPSHLQFGVGSPNFKLDARMDLGHASYDARLGLPLVTPLCIEIGQNLT